MRGGLLFVQIAAIVFAQAQSETFRFESWKSQNPKAGIAETSMPTGEKSAIEGAVLEVLKHWLGTKPANSELLQLSKLTAVKLFDVTGDGVPEVIAEGSNTESGMCSPTGNCPWWVFGKQGYRYIPLLESFGNGLSTDCSRKGRQCDISVFMHGSATEFGIKVYRFTDTKYAKVAEYSVAWPLDENGRTARQPTITKDQ